MGVWQLQSELATAMVECGRPLTGVSGGLALDVSKVGGLTAYTHYLTNLGYVVHPLAAGHRLENYNLEMVANLAVVACVLDCLDNVPVFADRLYDILSLGGRLVVVVASPVTQTGPHLWYFTPPSLRNMLAMFGFIDIQMTVHEMPGKEPPDRWVYCTCAKPQK